MRHLRRRLGLERCKRCGWRHIDWWTGYKPAKLPCNGPCTYETWEGLQ